MFLNWYLSHCIFLMIVLTVLFMILLFFFYVFSLNNFIHFFCFSYSSGANQIHCIYFQTTSCLTRNLKFSLEKRSCIFPKIYHALPFLLPFTVLQSHSSFMCSTSLQLSVLAWSFLSYVNVFSSF